MTLSSKQTEKTIAHSLILCFILTILPAAAFGQETVDQVIEKYLAASGGREKLSRIKSRVIRGEFSLPDMGMYAPLETYIQAPDKFLMWIDMAEFGEVTRGLNGDTAWDINPMTGPRILEGGEKQAVLRQATFNEFLDWKKFFSKGEVAGDETVDDEACIKVVLTPVEGEPIEVLFSKDSGLVRRIITNQNGQNVESTLSDYREVDGIKIPFLMELVSPQFRFEIQTESIEHNVDIPAEKFKIPDELKALMN